MYAGKRCNSRSNLTKRYKLDRVAPVDNRPPLDNNFGPKQMCPLFLWSFVVPLLSLCCPFVPVLSLCPCVVPLSLNECVGIYLGEYHPQRHTPLDPLDTLAQGE